METYSYGDIIVYTEHDYLRNDITQTDIVEYERVIKGYLARN